MGALRADRGTTLVELVVAAGLAAAALVAPVVVMATQAALYRRLEARATAAQTARLVLEVVSRDVRRAGFDPRGTGLAPILSADAGGIVVQADDDGDGSVDAHSEEVTAYAFRPATGVLYRAVGRQTMPLAEGLSPAGFALAYLDGAGLPIDGAGGVSGLDLPRVRRVAIAIAVGAGDGGRGRPLAEVATMVALRAR
jgi:type II secretory pathway component PulJ